MYIIAQTINNPDNKFWPSLMKNIDPLVVNIDCIKKYKVSIVSPILFIFSISFNNNLWEILLFSQ